MDLTEASTLLGITLPIPLNTLKTTFRRRSREEHPDVSKHPEATSRFARLNEAYNLLLKDPTALEFTKEAARKLMTEEGFLLADLGKGLGPKTNGRPCEFCDARGYRGYKADRVPCPDCREVFVNIFQRAWAYKCRKCSGTGRFKRDGRDVGECFACNGTSFHLSGTGSRSNSCRTCHGRQSVDDPRGRTRYVRCTTCKGTGEILVFNPVLPKGLLTTR